MGKRGKVCLVLTILFITSIMLLPMVSAQTNNLIFQFSSPDKDDFTGYSLTLKSGNALFKETLKSSKIETPFSKTQFKQNFEAVIDDKKTPASDYFGTLKPEGKEIEKFQVYPIGVLQGSVLDTEGNLIPKAKLAFVCYSSILVEFPEKTDITGFFTVPKMPIGTCTVIASTENSAGKEDFEVKTGEVTTLEIILEKKVIATKSVFIYFAISIIAILIIASLIWLLVKRNQKKAIKESIHEAVSGKSEKSKDGKDKESEPEKEEENEEDKIQKDKTLSSQTKAIMETLSGKEKEIVNFLLENNFSSSQAKIRHSLNIPRTSLARILQSLEGKKIVQIEKEGKMVSIKLTKFFLGR